MLPRHKLLIKNMVCQRCIMTVEHILRNTNIPFRNVAMGEVELERKLEANETEIVRSELSKVGFDVIETRLNKIIEDIKLAIPRISRHTCRQAKQESVCLHNGPNSQRLQLPQ
jgi:hypothetical protein